MGDSGVSIKVCVRCRPFVKKGQLGVRLVQNSEQEGEVEVLNSKYSTTRFPFTYAWWSAYGWQRHIAGEDGVGEASPDDMAAAEGMLMVDQKMAYDSCGVKIMDDLMQGNAVVMFAYGLSGSGKTFTVFGPDAPDIPEAWFKHAEPHPLWGILPNLMYELFKVKQDGWKISMKYFQNVVDTVRDLMSAMGKEMNYKTGMKKDKDGFMDIDWCESEMLETWDDLRKAFMSANARKAIAPTQFNHQSTRGHCILTITVEKPHPEIAGMKQVGRLYVCDLAGTEPAGDIVYANYKKHVFDDGSIEHEYLGPSDDQSKTKALQDQGKKINLSLSEMANFFLKMAQAVQEKKLAAGQSIPGCNNYFLCKFLKDTMLQARTYLFCAIRPEVEFHKYTFATLGFAKNASVIKLQPKKATSAASKRELQLMEELEKMKQMLEQMQARGGSAAGGQNLEELNRLMAEKQQQLVSEMKGEVDSQRSQEMEKQKQQYAARGIAMTYFEPQPSFPHLVNLDEDSFRDRRFLFMLSKATTSFGKSSGDITPLNMNMVDDHCRIEKVSEEEVYLVGGKGEVFVNGEVISSGVKRRLNPYDRVVVGQDVMLFKLAWKETDKPEDEPDAKVAVQEYHRAMQAKDSKYQEQAAKLEEDKRKLLEELERMKKEGQSQTQIEQKRKAMEAWKAIDETMMEMVPVLSRMTDMCNKIGRGMINFKLSLQQPKSDHPFVKIQVTNTETDTMVYIDPFELQSNSNILSDQILSLKTQENYTVPASEDIAKLLFDTSYQIGSCTNFLLHCTLYMETDDEDRKLDVMKSVIPYNKIGTLDVFWKPLNPENPGAEPEEVVDASALIGKPWAYELDIGKLVDLPTKVVEAYVSFDFYGTRYVTDTVVLEKPSREVKFNHREVLRVDCVDEGFLKYLDEVEFKFEIFIKPSMMGTFPTITNSDPKLCQNLGIVMSQEALANDPKVQVEALKKENAELVKQLQLLRDQKYEEAYKRHVAQLEEKIKSLESKQTKDSKVVQKMEEARETDKRHNQ